MRRIAIILSVIVIMFTITSLYLASCGGGGGGGGGYEEQPPPPGGTGTGANGVVIFWYPYDTNVAVGAGNAVQETSDHGFVVAGTQANDFSSPGDVSLMKTDSKGTALWKKRFSWTGGAMANAVRQTSDGGYIVVGGTGTQTGNRRVYALKTDASGNAAPGWPKTYGASESHGYAVLEVSNPAGYMIVGYQYVQQEYENVYVIRTDTNGMVVWENSGHWTPCFGAGEFGRALAATPDGNYVIAGTAGCNGWKGFLLKIDDQGNILQGWPKIYGGTSSTNNEGVYSVAVAPDGFVLAGSRSLVSSGQPPIVGPPDALVIKTDLSGNELWRRTYGGSDKDEAFAVTLAKNNGYLVIGYTQSYGGTVDPNYEWQYQDVFLMRLDSSGNTLWQKVKGNRPMSSDLGAAGCAVSDGGFAVTGSSGGNVLLAKFDENGDNVYLGATDLSITVPSKMGTITFGNAIDVAAAGVTAIKDARDVGANAVDLLIAKLNGVQVSNYCTGGGSYTFNPVPSTPLAGNTFTLTFVDCVTGPAGDTTKLNGSATMTIDSVSSDSDLISTMTYTVKTMLTSIGITAAETAGTLSSTITGSMSFERQATNGNLAEMSQSVIPTSTLTVSENDGTTRTRVVGPFSMHDSISSTGAYSYGTATDSAVVDSGLGLLTVSIQKPIQGSSLGTAPASGSFSATAPDSSRLTATITNGVAALAIDTDGDGTIDGTVSVLWDFLD